MVHQIEITNRKKFSTPPPKKGFVCFTLGSYLTPPFFLQKKGAIRNVHTYLNYRKASLLTISITSPDTFFLLKYEINTRNMHRG